MLKGIAKFILRFVDIKGMLLVLIDEKLEKEIDRIVGRTDNNWDNQAKMLIYPVLEKEMLKVVNEMDIEALLGLKEEAV